MKTVSAPEQATEAGLAIASTSGLIQVAVVAAIAAGIGIYLWRSFSENAPPKVDDR
ncbi:MAG: hypothetical protein AAGK37_14865 [Pseudomonadota bacterium]